VDSQSHCVEVNLTSIGETDRLRVANPTRSCSSLSLSGGFSIFDPPVFQVSSWLTLLSQTPVCMVQLLLEIFKYFSRSAALMFDAAKSNKSNNSFQSSKRILRLVRPLPNISSQLSPLLLKQSDTVLTSRITNSSLSC
jgi:hypothetical protein